MQKLIALISTIVLIVFGMMFSAVLLAFILVAGVVVFTWLWWKTRAVRKLMREQRGAMNEAANDAAGFTDENFKGEIIEGEVIRKVVSIEEIKR
jgi:ABC-type transport system involved in Fe-S cluster assembly fused permease/ATPase subunit